jgi:hypothetical protein
MAKARTTSRGKSAAAASATGARRAVLKGTLEVGNPRREAAASGPVPRASAGGAAREAAAQLPGEKAVKRTGRTVPVGPKRRAAAGAEPLPPAALDRRRQVVGTDELPGRGRR